MEEDQERVSSSDEERQIIEDEDMEDSPTDTPDLWMSQRNEEDTKFVRTSTDAIPTKRRPETASELSIVQERKQILKDLVRGGMETQTSSVADQYFRDAVCDTIWERNTVTFQDDKQWQGKNKWLSVPDPRAHENMYIFTIVRTTTSDTTSECGNFEKN